MLTKFGLSSLMTRCRLSLNRRPLGTDGVRAVCGYGGIIALGTLCYNAFVVKELHSSRHEL